MVVSIERMAEMLGVNFYDLHPLLIARDEWIKGQVRKEVVDWVRQYHGLDFEEAKAKLKEWGLS